MIDRIIEFSANRKGLVLGLTAAAALAGYWAMRSISVDALPDLSDTQVIVYSRWDRSPDAIENQVTYPIVTALLGSPKVKTVRGISDYGSSFVYVIYADGTDLYWARSRTLEYLSPILSTLPSGVKTELGPDATSLGWVFQYVLHDKSGSHSLEELRSYQDWRLRYYLKSVQGVADVVSLGGPVRQYQVNVDPKRLRAYGIPISRVAEAVRSGNSDSGGRLIEFGGTEYMIRSRGYAHSLQDFENIAVASNEDGSAIRIKDIGAVSLGPEIRRGVADLDGAGEAVTGIVIMRQGENALAVIGRIKEKVKQLQPGLPKGVVIDPIYDRSVLVQQAIGNLRRTLIEVAIVVSLVIFLFLWHVPSAAITVITIPAAVLISFLPFYLFGLSANIMSLGGIVIAVGALVDASIVVVEQSHKKLEEWHAEGRRGDYRDVIVAAIKEAGRPAFYALLVLAVSFLPVLALEAQEGRLFKPLAYTKTFAMLIAAVLAITLDPALRLLLTRVRISRFQPGWLYRVTNTFTLGRIRSEREHPICGRLIRLYEPVVAWSLRRKWFVLGAAAAAMALTIPAFRQLGYEFMPPLDEGAALYMPSTAPGISVGEAQRLLQVTDGMIRQFPQVDHVLGKAGRAETPTDPAPLSMLETLITFKPESEWPRIRTWYSGWAPEWMLPFLRHLTPDHVSRTELMAQMDSALRIPGLANAWTMPIKGRIDMLSTGLRTSIGLKVQGADPAQIEAAGTRIESVLARIQGARGVFAERVGGGYYVDVDWDREALARYGLSIEDASASIQSAIGGEVVTTTVEGRARFPVNVRYQRDFRSDLAALGNVLVSGADGRRQIPLSELARIETSTGPAMLRDEDGLLTGYVYVDLKDRDVASFIADANRQLQKQANLLPPGYSLTWSGEFEAMQRVRDRLKVIVPLTLLLIALLLYLNTRSVAKSLIVLLAVPFSAIGAVWSVYLLGYNLSIAVWIGFIALMGVDAETGIFMLLYLDLASKRAWREGRLETRTQLHEAIMQGAAQRIRPKVMTVSAIIAGLIPIFWSTGVGSDVLKRIAAPMIGGIVTSFLIELVVCPAIYEIWRGRRLRGADNRFMSPALARSPLTRQ